MSQSKVRQYDGNNYHVRRECRCGRMNSDVSLSVLQAEGKPMVLAGPCPFCLCPVTMNLLDENMKPVDAKDMPKL